MKPSVAGKWNGVSSRGLIVNLQQIRRARFCCHSLFENYSSQCSVAAKTRSPARSQHQIDQMAKGAHVGCSHRRSEFDKMLAARER